MVRDNADMEPSPQLEAFFELCKRIYERMEREGTWQCTADSTNPEDMVDSESNQNDVGNGASVTFAYRPSSKVTAYHWQPSGKPSKPLRVAATSRSCSGLKRRKLPLNADARSSTR